MKRLPRFLAVCTLALASVGGEAGERTSDSGDEEINVPGERPFDAVNIFGDLRKFEQLPDAGKNKLWWERMVRGEVGKDRFFILCALKDGNWKSLIDIRTYLEFQLHQGYSAKNLYNMLVLMAGKPYQKVTPRNPNSPRWAPGEGWLEKNPVTEISGVNTQWRIAPSVLPLLYFLLMGCPEEERCE